MIPSVIPMFQIVNAFIDPARFDDWFDQINRFFLVIVMCLFGCVTTLRYTGAVISCHGFNVFKQTYAEEFCWSQGLFTIQEAYVDNDEYNLETYPGLSYEALRPYSRTRIYHNWFQWIPFYFWLSGAAFYSPYLLLKYCGYSKMRPIFHLLLTPESNAEEDRKRSDTVDKCSEWLYGKMSTSPLSSRCNHDYSWEALSFDMAMCRLSETFDKHRLWLMMLIVKFLYLSTSVCIMIMTNEMISAGRTTNVYFTYGIHWLRTIVDFTNAPQLVKDHRFPKLAACEMKQVTDDANINPPEYGVCILPANSINQYIFLILWFLLVFACITNVVSCLHALFTLLPFVEYGYRSFLSHSLIKNDFYAKALYINVNASSRVILHAMARNSDAAILEKIVINVSRRVADDLGLNVQNPGKADKLKEASGAT